MAGVSRAPNREQLSKITDDHDTLIQLERLLRGEITVRTLSSQDGSVTMTFTGEGDDAGIALNGGQLTVEDDELIAGKDSFPVPIAFHCTDGDTSGKTITNATDVTTIMQSDALSSTGLFGGTAAGNYILVGTMAPFEGVKIKYDSLATVEPDNVCAEFYTDSIGDWTCVDFMATNSSFPYEETADNIAQNDSEQVFFGFNPLIRDQPSVWEASTFTINGEELTYHWARFRIETAITGDPVVQQIKIHTDRIEIESQGIFKYGRARAPISLPYTVVKNNLSTPLNEVVSYTSNFDADYVYNEFAYTTTDGIGVVINRPFGLDTSVPITIILSGYVKGTGTGDLDISYEVSQVLDGFIYDGSEPFDSYEVIVPITSPQNLQRFSATLVANISKLEAGADIVVNMLRNGTSPNDTLSNNVVLAEIKVSGYAWKI